MTPALKTYTHACFNCDGTGRDGHGCGTYQCKCREPVDTIPCGLCDGRGVFTAPERRAA